MDTRFFFLLLSLFCQQVEASQEQTWEFYSKYGQIVQFVEKGEEYSFFSGDVGEIGVNCPTMEGKYHVCVNSTFISLAVPSVPPEGDGDWEIKTRHGKAKFEVESIIAKIEWLGTTLNNIYVIRIIETETAEGSLPQATRTRKAWFTYKQGWIAFEVGDDEPVQFVTSRLPSIGAVSAPSVLDESP